MKKGTVVAGLTGLSLILTGIGISAANAAPTDEKPNRVPRHSNPPPVLSEEQRQEMKNQHEAVSQAIEAGDYELWKSLMEQMIPEDKKEKMSERLTQENFDKMVEMHNKMKLGDNIDHQKPPQAPNEDGFAFNADTGERMKMMKNFRDKGFGRHNTQQQTEE